LVKGHRRWTWIPHRRARRRCRRWS
jgi:hypothetical protein